MGRSLKKGPYASESLLKKIDEMNEKGEKKSYKDLVKSFYDISQNGWTHYCHS